ncbi:leucine-rich repeat domain-containing protein [Gimesia algae]|uniref:Leucine Rich repeats (2 copies) n=1 Tax=Gimesia algae TaxID=2527971 RepID=A0A517V7D0_9PLAN|nr:leucine-rich repeat domain-containing protein [Gimesia algae]QDT88913.1 Leucine Rich repeats (2 copies) [Gimesia algae]
MQPILRPSKTIPSLLVVLSIVCSLAVGCGKTHDPNSKEATEYVLKLGGTVIPVHSELPIETPAKIPEGNFAIRKIDLTNAKLKNIELGKLSNLRYLESLNLHRTNLTDEGLTLITDLPKLQSLEIAYTPVTDKAISQLTRFPKLRKIFLYGTAAKPQTLEDLKSNLKGCTIYK